MNFTTKRSLFCVVVFCTVLCSADEPYTLVDLCFVQHLKGVGKLNVDILSTEKRIDPLVCHVVSGQAMEIIKSTYNGEIRADMPNDADCLTDEFSVQRSVENVAKIRLFEKSSLNDTEKEHQMAEARNEFTQNLEKIATHCRADQRKFVNIFHLILGIKNETLEAHQTVYCLTRYAVAAKVLDFGTADINPHNIDPEGGVDCDGIVELEKIRAERELRNLVSGTPAGSRSLDCIMDAYRSGEVFRYQIALRALYHLDLTKETKALAAQSPSTNFSNFLRSSFSTCVRSSRLDQK